MFKISKKNKTILLSECIETFILTIFLLILVSIEINKKPLIDYMTFKIYTHSQTLLGFILFIYIFLLIAILILIFERWSANLNPVVSIYKLLIKKCNKKETFEKMIAQFIGAFIAGGLALLLAYLTSSKDFINSMGGFYINNIVHFNNSNGAKISTSFIIAFIIEFLAAMGVCYFLFSNHIKKEYHFLTISIYFGLAIGVAIDTGVVGFNPARSFGPILWHDFYLISTGNLNIYNSELLLYPVFFIAPILGVYSYFIIEKKYSMKLETFFKKILLGKKNIKV